MEVRKLVLPASGRHHAFKAGQAALCLGHHATLNAATARRPPSRSGFSEQASGHEMKRLPPLRRPPCLIPIGGFCVVLPPSAAKLGQVSYRRVPQSERRRPLSCVRLIARLYIYCLQAKVLYLDRSRLSSSINAGKLSSLGLASPQSCRLGSLCNACRDCIFLAR